MKLRSIAGHQLYKAFKDAHEAVSDIERALATMSDHGDPMSYARSVLQEELKAKKSLIYSMNNIQYAESPEGEVEIRPKAVWDTLWILYREVDSSSTSTLSITIAKNEVEAAMQRTGTPMPVLGINRPEWAQPRDGEA